MISVSEARAGKVKYGRFKSSSSRKRPSYIVSIGSGVGESSLGRNDLCPWVRKGGIRAPGWGGP